MMKDWTDVSVRYRELKKSDPEAAKKLKSDLMARVRKTMTALEVGLSLPRFSPLSLSSWTIAVVGVEVPLIFCPAIFGRFLDQPGNHPRGAIFPTGD